MISSAEIPHFISRDQIEELGHVARISAEESLNTLVYLNRDGTKTKYITRDPIKYTDANGKAQFIDLSLVEKAKAYETAANDILLSIAKDATKGVSVAGGGMAVTLTAMPANQDSSGNITAAPMVTTTTSNGAVTYNDLFGAGIDARYTPLYNGVKEDIILEAYTGVSSFDFILRTGGMEVFEDENGYYIAKEKDSAEQLRLGNVVAYDAKIRMREGTLLVTPIKEGEIYRLTVSVDAEFLKSPDTTYPVAIDPSLTVSDTTHGSGAIYDTPVYSGMPNSNFGSYQYNCIGYVDSSYKIGRVAIKLQGLINDSDYTKLSADAIQQVRFYVRDSSGSSAKTVNIYALRSLNSWTEGSLTWNNTLGNISSDLQASASIGSNAWTSFDITSLVKGWKNNTYSAASGFIMKGDNESVGTNIISTEYGSSSYWPYVVMTYLPDGSGGSGSISNATALTLGSSHAVNIAYANERKYFKFTPSSDGFYTFESSANTGDPQSWLYNSTEEVLTSNDDGADERNFRITYHLVSGVTYYFAVGCYGTGTGNYSVKITKTTLASRIGTSPFAWGDSKATSCTVKYKVVCYKFTPSLTQEYMFYSTKTGGNPKIWLYDSSLRLIGTNQNGAGDLNFRLAASLTAGNAYYIVAGQNGVSTGNYSVNVLMGANISNGTYYLKNIGTSRYIDIHGPTEQEWVHQWEFHGNVQSRWNIQKQSDGYYTIRSEYGSKNILEFQVQLLGMTT